MALTINDVALVLDAVAKVEGWDDIHDSIKTKMDGSWAHADNGIASPMPSIALMNTVRDYERQQYWHSHGRRTKTGQSEEKPNVQD